MLTSHLGEFFALLTAVFWTTTSLSFQQATRRAGSLSVNVLRLIIAFFIYFNPSSGYQTLEAVVLKRFFLTLQRLIFNFNHSKGLRPLRGFFRDRFKGFLINIKWLLMNILKIFQITKIFYNNIFIYKCFSI